MDERQRISTGIGGLDEAIDFLRPGDTVIWQCEHISDYMYVATRFVTSVARTGHRIVYIRFGDHEEIMDADALAARGSNVKKYVLDPHVGFETFAVQVHRIIKAEERGSFFVFDCLSELQKYWFSDLMISNFFVLLNPFLQQQEAVAYQAITYERHTYDTIAGIRRATSVLINVRTVHGSVYVHPVKVAGRHTPNMFFPLRVRGAQCECITSSTENSAVFDMFTLTGEHRDCWDSMFDSVDPQGAEPTDEAGLRLKENIMSCLLGNEPTRLELCRKYFSMKDLMYIKSREIGTGCIGGKATGMLLARNILRDENPDLYHSRIDPHDSYYIGADLFYTYAVQNGVWAQRTEMVREEDYFRCAPIIKDNLLNGEFMPQIKEQFISMLEYFGQSPIIVRSSSLLEDGFGNGFVGKYESVFCPNQGTLEERYEVFEQAVRTVYASTMNPEAIKYRADRNLLNKDEQMALLVMRVCGDIHGRLYFPHFAGVGHSKNLYITGSTAKVNRGMLRLVVGMGTRAVDRGADDYARFVDLSDPLAPPRVEYGDEYRYSQHKVDVIDLDGNDFTSVRIDSVDKSTLKTDVSLYMEPDLATAARFREMGLYGERVPDIVNFRKLLKSTDFTETMVSIMSLLQDKYSYPVDIEFASNITPQGEYRINLLQCRPLQTQGISKAEIMPSVREYYFKTHGNFMGGNNCLPIKYAVLVRVEPYLELTEQKKYQVARCIGELNTRLRDENTVLLGPGRWGTTTASLGVPVNFREISSFNCMAELAYSSHGIRPELSYGSHFFQDLVEAGVFYAALYPGEDGCKFNGELFARHENVYTKLMGTAADDPMADVIAVVDLSDEKALLYSEVESQLCFLAST